MKRGRFTEEQIIAVPRAFAHGLSLLAIEPVDAVDAGGLTIVSARRWEPARRPWSRPSRTPVGRSTSCTTSSPPVAASVSSTSSKTQQDVEPSIAEPAPLIGKLAQTGT